MSQNALVGQPADWTYPVTRAKLPSDTAQNPPLETVVLGGSINALMENALTKLEPVMEGWTYPV